MSYSIPSTYHLEIDTANKQLWSELLVKFRDASIYQTWSHGSVFYGDTSLSHLLLYNNSTVVAMAQVGLMHFPFLGTSIANVHWGPLWRRKDTHSDANIFAVILNCLKHEYVAKRGFLLRLWPRRAHIHECDTHSVLTNIGFLHNSRVRQYQTLTLSLAQPLGALRQNLLRKWRQALAKAERLHSLTLDFGHSQRYYAAALALYNQMHERKQFPIHVDMHKLGLVQNSLPDALKMTILICSLNSEPIAALGWSTIGDTGLPLLAATGDKALALSTNASNLLWWKMIEHMKSNGCISCDLAGIDPDRNPGGYKFKLGLAGALGVEEQYIGQFYNFAATRAHILNFFIDLLNPIRNVLRFR